MKVKKVLSAGIIRSIILLAAPVFDAPPAAACWSLSPPVIFRFSFMLKYSVTKVIIGISKYNTCGQEKVMEGVTDRSTWLPKA